MGVFITQTFYRRIYARVLSSSAAISLPSELQSGVAQEAEKADPFEGCEPLPGREELGRAIKDKSGAPSGSPANYEFLRGSTERDPE
jgi:hypothetical protein